MLLALVGCAVEPSATTPGPTVSVEPEPAVSAPPTDGAFDEEPDPAQDGAYLDYVDGVIEATAGAKVLFFHASWCPQCRALDEELNREGAPDGLTVFKVDYDDRGDLRQKYGVTLQTTVVYVGDDGEALASAVLYDDPSIDSLLAAAP
ncbi:thioredoxin family protein [Microbacterium aurugineum]